MRADDPLRILAQWLPEEEGEGTRSEESDDLVQALEELAAAEGADVTMQRFLKQTGVSEWDGPVFCTSRVRVRGL